MYIYIDALELRFSREMLVKPHKTKSIGPLKAGVVKTTGREADDMTFLPNWEPKGSRIFKKSIVE